MKIKINVKKQSKSTNTQFITTISNIDSMYFYVTENQLYFSDSSFCTDTNILFHILL